MSHKPTSSSVTEAPCTCNYLQSAVDDPDNPIAFDDSTGEFQFRYSHGKRADSDPGMLILFHCPFCGGAAPKSKRDLLFARIENGEVDRLAELLAPIQTLADVLKVLGTPDTDAFGTSRTDESGNRPSTVERHRHLVYGRLSDTADVWFQVMRDKTVHWQLHGKQL
jgi:hypothetical protein